MTGLLLRYDPSRKVLASLGDPPNGLVCALTGDDGRMRFCVNPHWQPEVDEPGAAARPEAEIADVTEVGVRELVDACADWRARRALWQAAAVLANAAVVEAAVEPSELEAVSAAVELWRELADAFEEDDDG